MFKCVIFDFDMTLVDSSYAIRDAMNMLAERQGLPPVTRERVLEVIGMPIKESWIKIWNKFEDEWLDYYRETFLDSEFKGMYPFPGTEKVLNFLKEKNVALGVASNRLSPVKPMKATGLYDYFGSALGMGDVENAKPAPDMILKGLEELGFGREESLYVGDTADDVAAARAAGVKGLGLTTGGSSRDRLMDAGAWRVADSIEELMAFWEEEGR